MMINISDEFSGLILNPPGRKIYIGYGWGGILVLVCGLFLLIYE